MPSDPVETRSPLNRATVYPYRVDAFPQDWLRQFAGFQPIAASPEDGESPSAQHYED